MVSFLLASLSFYVLDNLTMLFPEAFILILAKTFYTRGLKTKRLLYLNLKTTLKNSQYNPPGGQTASLFSPSISV